MRTLGGHGDSYDLLRPAVTEYLEWKWHDNTPWLAEKTIVLIRSLEITADVQFFFDNFTC